MIFKLAIISLLAGMSNIIMSTGLSRHELNPSNEVRLFKIERNVSPDVVVYDVNILSDGKLNLKDPVHVYWLKHTEGDKSESLTWVQKTFGYGVKYLAINSFEVKFRFVSYLHRNFIMKKDDLGLYKVYTSSEDGLVEVIKLHVNFDGGTFLSPKISSVELYGRSVNSGKEILEIIQ